MAQPPPPKRDNRLPGLEALRFIAALCILLLHTRAVFGGQRVFGHGYLAVELGCIPKARTMYCVNSRRAF